MNSQTSSPPRTAATLLWTRTAGSLLIGLICCAASCDNRDRSPQTASSPATSPAKTSAVTPPAASQPETPAGAEATVKQVQTQPTPTTQPTSQPESSYSSRPPYPVQLFVTDPEEKQPGWLRIEKLEDAHRVGTAHGTFPEQNLIRIETGNVTQLRIHVGHLPLRANKRLILQIDGQGMVISREEPFATLEKRPTGEWVVRREK